MRRFLLFILTLSLFSCAKKEVLDDYQMSIKHLNDQAFKERLYNSNYSIQCADSALILLYQDSVNLIENHPDFYYDNVVRALNSKAYENFLLSDFKNANENINKVYKIDENYPNKHVEIGIANIINAKMMMRLRASWEADELLKKIDCNHEIHDTLSY